MSVLGVHVDALRLFVWTFVHAFELQAITIQYLTDTWGVPPFHAFARTS